MKHFDGSIYQASTSYFLRSSCCGQGYLTPYLFSVIGLFAAVAIIIFGIKGDGQFLPDYEHNYLSWSFGLAFVGAVFSEVAGVLFLIEARIIRRKEIARDKQFPMEQRV